MKQHYDQYTPEDHTIWNILFDRQIQNLQGKSCQAYLDCVDRLSPEMTPSQVPDFGPLECRLQAETGWRIEVVKGLIPVEDFFQLLAEKRFCSFTWLRTASSLITLKSPTCSTTPLDTFPCSSTPRMRPSWNALGRSVSIT